jgi:hypothetical protein
MKSFAEYVEMKEGIANVVRGAVAYHKQDQRELEVMARRALHSVIENLRNSKDPKLKYLWSGGYAHELDQIINFLKSNRTQSKAQQKNTQAQQTQQGQAQQGQAQQTQQGQAQQTQQGGFARLYTQDLDAAYPLVNESIGQAIGNWAGSGGLLGGMWNKMTRSKEMVQHNELENKAIQALQSLADRVNYEKGEMYYSGYGSRIQWYVNWLKKAQAFNNTSSMGVDYESPPEGYVSYRRVNPHLRSKRVYSAGQQLPASPSGYSGKGRDPRFA